MAIDLVVEKARLKPIKKIRVMDLLAAAGMDVSHWGSNFRGKHPSANPKYCYNWSFEQPGERIAVCLWHNSLEPEGGKLVFHRKPRAYAAKYNVPGAAQWNARDADFAHALETAYRQQLPVRVIVVDGERRGATDPNPKASKVKSRLLDPTPWAVTQYEPTGRCVIVRGASPELPAVEPPDTELSWFEGKKRWAYIQHRHREGEARRRKIDEAMAKNKGRIVCEVQGCGFDYVRQYGSLGEGYAQVHHLLPLGKAKAKGRETKLSDLAIVCANCHAMIHRGGDCRPLSGLIPR